MNFNTYIFISRVLFSPDMSSEIVGSFSIVQEEDNKKGMCLTTVPSNWVVKGGFEKRTGLATGLRNTVIGDDLLCWPKLKRDKHLRMDSSSQPKQGWRQICCIIKRENFATFELSEQELMRMDDEYDTEEESRVLLSTVDREAQSKNSSLQYFQYDPPPSPPSSPAVIAGKAIKICRAPATVGKSQSHRF